MYSLAEFFSYRILNIFIYSVHKFLQKPQILTTDIAFSSD